MTHLAETTARSFAVEDVVPARAPRPTVPAAEAIEALSRGRAVEASSAEGLELLAGVCFHPLVAAVHFAYSEHRPLTLSPDIIWSTIVQGFAQHVARHDEELRSRLVAHPGKARIVVETDFSTGWEDAIEAFAGGLRASVGDELCDLIEPAFSTTGALELTVGRILLLDALQPYHHYELGSICGIPEVTLEGSVADWAEIRRRVGLLRRYDLGWWVDALAPICEQLEWSARGQPVTRFWRGIYKLKEAYGGGIMNGWLADLFPYLQDHSGRLSVRSHRFLSVEPGETGLRARVKKSGVRVSARTLPSGLSSVPVKLHAPGGEKLGDMVVLGGFVGVAQDPQTLALRPQLGWALRRLPISVKAMPDARAVSGPSGERRALDALSSRLEEVPSELLALYEHFEGAGFGESAALPMGSILTLESSERCGPEARSVGARARGWRGALRRLRAWLKARGASEPGRWFVFAALVDGDELALEIRRGQPWPVVRIPSRGLEPSEEPRVVAEDLEALLRQILPLPA